MWGHSATGDTGARSGGDTPHTSGQGEDSTRARARGWEQPLVAAQHLSCVSVHYQYQYQYQCQHNT